MHEHQIQSGLWQLRCLLIKTNVIEIKQPDQSFKTAGERLNLNLIKRLLAQV